MGRIILDKKRGVDPIMSQCFFCLKTKNEIILAGAAGTKMRRSAGAHEDANTLCFNEVPCDECKEMMKIGVILISVQAGSNHENPYRTGGWCVVKEEAVKRIFNDDRALKSRVAFIEDDAWDKIGLPRLKPGDEEIDNRNEG